MIYGIRLIWVPRIKRNSVRTRYGTEAELLEMMEVAHRFGIRVYFDNIMNHRAFDVPGYNENTPIDTYPGMVPEDFPLKKNGGRLLPQVGQLPRLGICLAGAKSRTFRSDRYRPRDS